MNNLREWMQARKAPVRRGRKVKGLSRAEAAKWLEDALKRRVTVGMIRYWETMPELPQDVQEYITPRETQS